MTPRFAWIASLLLGCGGAAAAPSVSAPPAPPPAEQRRVVAARLETKLATDPNRALCDQIARGFAEGDHDAIKPAFDAHAFVERIVAYRPLPPEVVQRLRDRAEHYEKFSEVLSPPGSKFRCLGTRTFLGAPHLAIRQWTDARFDYVLFRLGRDRARPIEDWIVVSGGAYHSEAQAFAFDPRLSPFRDKFADMFQKSYDGDFAGIIADYRSLPVELQATPSAFMHFINAVYSTEQPGSPLYAEATTKLGDILRGRDVAIAYWQLFDGKHRNDAALMEQGRRRLLELLDDYELLSGGVD